MKITKNKKTLPEQTQHNTNSLLISSDLPIQSLYDILTKNPPLINKVDRNTETFLSYALKRKNIEICEFLLTSPIIDLNFRDKKGNSYLHLAVCNLNEDIVNTIIRKGCDINAKNINGDTPLHIACSLNIVNIQSILIENGADEHITNNNGITPSEMNNSDVNNNVDSMLHIEEESSVCYVNTETQHNREMSSNMDINNTNQSIKMDWSESNVKTHFRNLNLSNDNSSSNPNQVYAKSFVEAPHFKKHPQNVNTVNVNNAYNNASGDTRYNSSANKSINKEDDDLFDITGSIDSFKKDNNDKITVQSSLNENNTTFNLSKSINDNTNPIKEYSDDDNDDYVNTRVMNSQGLKLSQSNERRYNISISGSFMKSKDNSKHIVIREETEETGNNAMNEDKPSLQESMKGYMEIEDPFTFSSPHIDEINQVIEQNKMEHKQTLERFDEDVDEHPKDQMSNLNKINYINNEYSLNNDTNNVDNYNKDISPLPKEEDKDNKYHLEVFDFPQSSNTTTNSCNDPNPPLPASTISPSNPNETHPLYKFLADIQMEKHFNTLLSTGYDDINLLIEQTKKKNIIVKDENLKSIGLNLPGERAKILIYLQEKAKIFPFSIPKRVYYLSSTPNEPNQDCSLKKMENWLTGLNLQSYLMKFINNGYHSLDLLMLQMKSQCPLTKEILKDEIGIEKPGYRERIMNSLSYEADNYYKKNKFGVLAFETKGDIRSCNCFIF